ncbi:excinuclease ABC subunit UvrC [Candidatus Parcubacteria bacterium]|nr:excinuclease ABC subunit UvrC [Patescibacteria group bacterium]MBU4309364.1 excinuclease ABC subunit UvrC [Patescibacteria group bacterium]MBU4432571.1 excinuclease ABC subunit UvrC [Patescibacteria group bacterium]MBU4577725.1 excinuclease ABC subunit UvrC [Patescibacteria group bacterium]MCG2697410.1 excinuclease ABC subunit UvrC [Candidatus Parcubacteria bacterium]
MNLEQVKNLDIPKTPGSYQFKDASGKIIYIGKAVDLRSRVLSYWREATSHTPAKYSMLKKVASIEWIEVESEIEALLLEANLIKKFQPEYNVVMRDDKRYIYIEVSTEDEYPRIFMTRNLDKKGKYFGPFVSTEAVRETLKALRKIWPYRSCKNMPKRACLYYRLGKCQGVCESLVSKQEYAKTIKQIVLFLDGGRSVLIKNYELRITKLEKELKKGDNTDEQVQNELGKLKYELKNINNVLDHSKVLSLADKYAGDVVELAKTLGLSRVPNRIEGYDISNLQGKEAVGSMVVFKDGEPDKNEYRKFKIKDLDLEGDVWMLEEVLERRMKHFDHEYQIDSSLAPAGEGRGEGKIIKDKDIWENPDLLIVDGGKAQLGVLVRILKKHKLDIPVIAISKGDGLRGANAPDKIFFPGEKKPLELPLASPALHLIKRVRDEAHRFAIEYHRGIRAKRFLKR